MSESKNKIEVINLTKKFGDLLVLDDISFSIKKGEFVCVVGPTGCGKTTFLNLLCCLLQQQRRCGRPASQRHSTVRAASAA